MLNFGASKPRVKGGARAPRGPPLGSAPVQSEQSPKINDNVGQLLPRSEVSAESSLWEIFTLRTNSYVISRMQTFLTGNCYCGSYVFVIYISEDKHQLHFFRYNCKWEENLACSLNDSWKFNLLIYHYSRTIKYFWRNRKQLLKTDFKGIDGVFCANNLNYLRV